jgi:O-antigen/teichoic acid export membrane protein
MAAEAAAKPGPAGSWARLTTRLRAQALRRLSWGLADQGVSSLTNAAVSIYVVRALGAAQFGAFSLALVTYWFGLNASRGLSTDPLMVRFSGKDVTTWRRAVGRCTGTAMVVGLVVGLGALGAAAVLHGTTTRTAFLALGLTFPGLLLQDSWRFSFFAHGRGGLAFVNDVIWAVVLFPALVLLKGSGHATVFWFVLAWGGAAGVAAAAGPIQAKVLPKPWAAWNWIRDHRDLGPRYVIEGVSSASSGQIRAYGISILLGLAAVGYVQASTTLMGPFVVIFFAMSLVMIPEASRILQRSPQRLRQFCLIMGGGLGAAGLAWGAVLLVALPHGLGQLLLGRVWRPTYPLVLPQMLATLGLGLSSGASAGLHALGAARRSLRAMLLSSAASLVCGLLGAVKGGAAGVCWGLVTASVISAAYTWWQLRAGLREHAAAQVAAARRETEQQQPASRQSGRHRRATDAAGSDEAAAFEPPPATPPREPPDELQLTIPMPRINYP